MVYPKNEPAFFSGQGKPEQPVVGLRNWRVDSLFRLTGVVYKQSIWTPGENKAVCLADLKRTVGMLYTAGYMVTQTQTLPADHDMDNCPHGFYAYYDGSRDYHDRGDVTGVIQGDGETVVGTKGFRCMKARILAVKFASSMPDMVRQRITRLYPDVAVFRSLDQMLAEYPTTAGGLEAHPENDDDFWTKEA